jgi:hypothetical protein
MLIEMIKACNQDEVNAQPKDVAKALKKASDVAVGGKIEIPDAFARILLEHGFARERIKVRLLGALKHKEIEYPKGTEKDFDAELANLFLGNGTAEKI